MMLKRRIIPCLDVNNGRTVKGINFIDLRDAGDPVELGALYARAGADELVYLDISATNEERKTFAELVSQVAKNVDIPFTVGGGISSTEDVEPLLMAGADKVAVNSAAVYNPDLINELVYAFGSQCIVVAVDARFDEGEWVVYTHGGKKPTDKRLFQWVKEIEDRGAGEILFTSMDHDGTKQGFALEALKKVCSLVNLPVIASGGAGGSKDFVDVFHNTAVSAALAASIFHFGEVDIKDLKEELVRNGIEMRL